jgi:predicted transcriptional regulator
VLQSRVADAASANAWLQMAKFKLGRSRPGQFDVGIGKRIRLRRIERKMSLAELANKLDVTFQQIHKYEIGQNRPGIDRLIQISRALDVPLPFSSR